MFVVFVGLCVGMMLSAIDATIVATALPSIVRDLNGERYLSWVATAYLLLLMASTPLYGKLGDLYGRKRIFQTAILIFLAGSILAGLSRNMGQLIACRALQGLGAGGLASLAMAITADIVPARDRGRFLGYQGLMFSVASIGGPFVGGVVVDHLSWRWVFYINMPVGLAALVIVSGNLHVASRRVPHAVDYAGAALLVGCVTSLVLVTSLGATRCRGGRRSSSRSERSCPCCSPRSSPVSGVRRSRCCRSGCCATRSWRWPPSSTGSRRCCSSWACTSCPCSSNR